MTVPDPRLRFTPTLADRAQRLAAIARAERTAHIARCATCGPTPVTPLLTERDGRIIVTWPEGRDTTTITPEAVEGYAESINQLRDALAEAQACWAADLAAVMGTDHEHRWLLHQSGRSGVPSIQVCSRCRRPNFDFQAAIVDDLRMTATCLADADRDQARAEADRLRGLLGEALDLLSKGLPNQIRRDYGPGSEYDSRLQASGVTAWNLACWIGETVAPPFVERIRREAGLT